MRMMRPAVHRNPRTDNIAGWGSESRAARRGQVAQPPGRLRWM
jgi:hypothetical protein